MIRRDLYLNRLISRMNNGSIKVVTGIRRCGKSVLLFNLFCDYLRQSGVDDDHILCYQLDNIKNVKFHNPETLYDDVMSRMTDSGNYYLLLDEIQYVKDFSLLMTSFAQIGNLDTYVTGSNSRFLSTDILTEFRGRGDEVTVYPLSFAEYLDACGKDKWEAWDEYHKFGGMPALLQRKTFEEKDKYLQNLVQKVYLSDITERNNVTYPDELEAIFNLLCSAVGSFTNPKKICDTLHSIKGKTVSNNTVANYLKYLTEAFLFQPVKRYDVKGKKYFDTLTKYYATDIGLRNALLNFRQTEENHIMENIIYNELKVRGYAVDVGVVEITESVEGRRRQKQLEIDFVVNNGAKKYYIQSAYEMPTEQKLYNEKRSLIKTGDSFKKIIIVKDNIAAQTDQNGIVTMGLFNFLLDADSLDR